jgi:hypothetical protein
VHKSGAAGRAFNVFEEGGQRLVTIQWFVKFGQWAQFWYPAACKYQENALTKLCQRHEAMSPMLRLARYGFIPAKVG